MPWWSLISIQNGKEFASLHEALAMRALLNLFRREYVPPVLVAGSGTQFTARYYVLQALMCPVKHPFSKGQERNFAKTLKNVMNFSVFSTP